MTRVAEDKLTIRRAVEADITEVVLLERETATAPHWPVADYAAMLRHGATGGLRRALFVAAQSRSSLCGFAVGRALRVGRDVEAELESVVVNPAVRRQGLGSSLCRVILEWSRGEGAHLITLEVRATSAGAIHLYGGLGFVASGRRKQYYQDPVDDAMLMRCSLLRRGASTASGGSEAPSGEAASLPATGWLDV